VWDLLNNETAQAFLNADEMRTEKTSQKAE
jgi:hypothetical protein